MIDQLMLLIFCFYDLFIKFVPFLYWTLNASSYPWLRYFFLSFTVLMGAIPVGMDASQIHLWDASYSVSETSQRGLIWKSLRRLRGDWLKTSPQRRLWFSRKRLELHLRLQFWAFQLRHCSSKAWLPVHLPTSLHIFFLN